MFDVEQFREEMRTKLKKLEEERDSYIGEEEEDEDSSIIRDTIRREIELLQWVIEQTYVQKQ